MVISKALPAVLAQPQIKQAEEKPKQEVPVQNLAALNDSDGDNDGGREGGSFHAIG